MRMQERRDPRTTRHRCRGPSSLSSQNYDAFLRSRRRPVGADCAGETDSLRAAEPFQFMYRTLSSLAGTRVRRRKGRKAHGNAEQKAHRSLDLSFSVEGAVGLCVAVAALCISLARRPQDRSGCRRAPRRSSRVSRARFVALLRQERQSTTPFYEFVCFPGFFNTHGSR